MSIKLKLLKKGDGGQESVSVKGGLLSNVKGKVIFKTPFGKYEILSDGKIKK